MGREEKLSKSNPYFVSSYCFPLSGASEEKKEEKGKGKKEREGGETGRN